ncbi:MAG TPA: threonine ammonia-lyase [Actinomycetota bacterium]|nr:threonine ammonia-lyase [Actinomycetota bacterium]
MELICLDDVREAETLLKGVADRTPLELSRAVSDRCAGTVFLKCENLQRTGAFKIRGAYNRIARLDDDERSRGIVAASAGNHAQGVALAAQLLGVEATVFMPVGAAIPKVEATARYGAHVTLEGGIYDEAFHAAQQFAAKTGAIMIHPFDHADVIAGQGTIALEILEQLPEAATLIVPVGGGGLISGVACAAKALKPSIRVVGVEPEGAASVSRAWENGSVIPLDTLSTVADGLAARQAGALCLGHVQAFVDQIVTVNDEEIAEALLLIAERAKMIVEPAGAAGVAALMSGAAEVTYPVVVLLSGGNIDPLLLLRVIRYGMGTAGRFLAFATQLPDRAGELERLAGVIADSGANIIGVEHRRDGVANRLLGDVEITMQLETRGPEHVKSVVAILEENGFKPYALSLT